MTQRLWSWIGGTARTLGVLSLQWAALGCAQRPLEELPVADGTAGTGDGALPAQAAAAGALAHVEHFFPLADGALWTFLRTDPEDGTRHDTLALITTSSTSGLGYQLTKRRDDAEDLEIDSWIWEGPRLLRRTRLEGQPGKLELRTEYEPGVPLFDLTWTRPGVTSTVRYGRVETDPAGTSTRSERTDELRVLATDATEDVPLGRFSPCLVVERTRDGGRTSIWFAEGVGKIKEVDQESLVTEELADVTWK